LFVLYVVVQRKKNIIKKKKKKKKIPYTVHVAAAQVQPSCHTIITPYTTTKKVRQSQILDHVLKGYDPGHSSKHVVHIGVTKYCSSILIAY